MTTVVLIMFVDLFVTVFNFLILIRVILSWVQPQPGRFGQVTHDLTEPILEPVRKLLPNSGFIDLAPIVTFFLLQLLQLGVHHLLAG
jgi:YggT family protein